MVPLMKLIPGMSHTPETAARRFLACQNRVAVGSADNKTARRIDIEKFVVFRSNLRAVS